MPPARSPLAGTLFVGLIAISFALNSACGGVAFEGGSNALTVLSARLTFGALMLYCVLRALGVKCRLDAVKRRNALLLGLLLGLYSYGLFGAIEHIPVALAVLTFYTYPVFTGLGAWITGQERPSRVVLAALAVAFCGLALALNVPGAGFNWTGIGLAILASVAITVLILLSGRLIGSGDSRPVTLHMLISGAGVMTLAMFVFDAAELPVTTKGWIGFAAVPIFYTLSITGFFVAVTWIGAIRTSIIMNFEPISSMLFGYLLLDQSLAPSQLLGAALVITAIGVVRYQDAKRKD